MNEMTEVIEEVTKDTNTKPDARESISRLGLLFLLGTLIIYAVQYGATAIVERVKPEWLEHPTISLVVAMMPMYMIGMPALIAIVRRMPAVVVEKHRMKWWQYVLSFIMCYSVMYGSNLMGTLITMVISVLKGSPVENQILDIATSANMGVTFLYMVICAPIFEEYIFRKLIVDRTVRFGQGVAIVLSGVMFGLFHGNLSQFIYATTLGMFLAFLYVKTGNLKITISLHMIINFMGGIVSVLLLRAIKYDELLILTETATEEQLMNFVMENALGYMAYGLYAMFLFVMVITGLVLFIVFRKKFRLVPGEISIPKKKRFQTVFLNLGMVVYCVFWIVMIIIQLLK
ncbi:MAG: CPBP family intramembrane metalloprotease [Lachnospiraceae bacterium]|nr:CPBP family intramembrane metalloprotease [Lachnospiraceae bacterium]